MPFIYIKLGTATEYEDDRLALHLNLGENLIKAALDYNNLTPEIHEGLNAGLIVQISEEEYNSLSSGPVDPISVDTNYLITLSNYMPPCPLPAFVMFGYYDSKWWKITWETIKACLGGPAITTPIKFRVGNFGNPIWAPVDAAVSFTHPDLIGITNFDRLLVLLNGVELHHKDIYPDAEKPDYNWYDINPVTGEFTPNLPFAEKDILSIR
jgi:hypothetical protein